MHGRDLNEGRLATENGFWFDSRSHSLRVGHSVTSVRLENAFWEVLSAMAAEQSITLNQLLAKIYVETSEMNGAYNTASILRVLCVQWATNSMKSENQQTGDHRPSRIHSVPDPDLRLQHRLHVPRLDTDHR